MAVEDIDFISAESNRNECPWLVTKQSDGEFLIWEPWSTPSLHLLPGLLWHGVVAPDKVLSMSQIELFDI